MNLNQIGLLQQMITWYKIRHAGGQAHYYSRTGTLKQRPVKLYWLRSLCFKRRNPKSRVEKDLNNLLSEIKSCSSTHDQNVKQMDPKTYHRLHSTDATPASFYGLPKIHKPGVPLRPITSCINAPTYKVSRHLVSILSPLLEEKYSVTNSVVFAQHIRDQPITEDGIMVLFDVAALFTSILVDLALQIVREKLQQDVTLTERTDISVTNIMRLLEFVLKNSFFSLRALRRITCKSFTII